MKGWFLMKNNSQIRDMTIDLGIYAGAIIYGIKKKNIKPFASIVALHTVEYFAVGKKIGKAAGEKDLETLRNCLVFGITWWRPLKKKLENTQPYDAEKFAKKGCGVRFVKD